MISKSHYPSSQNYTFSSNKSSFDTKFSKVNDTVFNTKFTKVNYVVFDTKFSQVGAIAEANVVYKKVDGAWVQKTDIQSMLSYLQNNNIRSV